MAFSDKALLIGSTASTVAGIYLLSNALLAVLPGRYFRSSLLTGGILMADVVLVSSCIYLSGHADTDLYLLYFLAILTAALIRDLRATVATAAVVSSVYLLASAASMGLSQVVTSKFLLRIPLFFVTSFFAGYLAKQARMRETERQRAIQATAELEQQLEITKHHERALLDEYRRLYEHHKNIMSSISSGILVTDRNGVVSIFNREAERITGLSASEVVDRALAELPTVAPFDPVIRKTLAGGTTSARDEMTLLVRGERPVPVGFSTSLLRDREGRVTGAIVVFRDLTEIKNLRDKVARSERLAFLGEMAASVAHEIRNPLNSISGFAQLLRERIDQDTRQHKYVQIIVEEAERIDKIIRQTLAFAKDDGASMEPVDLNEVINSMLSGMQDKLTGKSLKITLDLDPYLPPVNGNPLQLRQVCSNLVNNAVQVLNGNGELRITTHLEGDTVVARFEDTGPGIPAELKEKIFDPFFTTKPDGTGLGLALSQKILADHGGDIRIDDAVRRGSAFEIRLPVLSSEAVPHQHLRPMGAGRG